MHNVYVRSLVYDELLVAITTTSIVIATVKRMCWGFIRCCLNGVNVCWSLAAGELCPHIEVKYRRNFILAAFLICVQYEYKHSIKLKKKKNNISIRLG